MKAKFAFLLFVLFLMGGCGTADSVKQQVAKNYTDADGLIHAYPGDQKSEYLSESIGLYMEYLVLIEDGETFSAQYELLKNHFIVQDNDSYFIRWRLNENAATNALIDDNRIIQALKLAADTFGNGDYKELADQLSKSIASVQTQGSHTVDFYDWSLAMPAQRLTLSYADDNKTITADSFELLEDVEAAGVFFPEFYDTEANQYISGDEVHLIDQLLIALNRQKRGQPSEQFSEWLTEEWMKDQKLYGRYDRKTLEATVEYESLAVYHYLHSYFTLLDKTELADEVSRHSKKIATEEMLGNAHFFDFLHYQLMLENQ